MSGPVIGRPGVERRLSPGFGQLVLRALVVLGVLVSLVASAAAGAHPAGWVPVAVAALAVVTAMRPDSPAGIVTVLGAAYVWARVGDPHSPLVLVAAAGLVLTHVCALLTAQGPVLLRPDTAQVRLWAVRGVLLWLAAALVWAFGVLAHALPGGRLVYAVGLVVLVAVAVLATRLINPRRG